MRLATACAIDHGLLECGLSQGLTPISLNLGQALVAGLGSIPALGLLVGTEACVMTSGRVDSPFFFSGFETLMTFNHHQMRLLVRFVLPPPFVYNHVMYMLHH